MPRPASPACSRYSPARLPIFLHPADAVRDAGRADESWTFVSQLAVGLTYRGAMAAGFDLVGDLGPGCKPLAEDLLGEPLSAISSLAFVIAGLVILVGIRRGWPRLRSAALLDTAQRDARIILGLLVIGIGLGSVVQHGPNPWWADLAHDLPLFAALFFVGADAAADLSGRRRAWSWVGPALALVPLIYLAPRAGDLAQVAVAGLAIGLSVLRAARRPALRRMTVWAFGILAVAGVVGRLSDTGGPLCFPGSWWHGHSLWHVGASVALVVLAPVVGARPSVGPQTPVPADPRRTGADCAP
jgi:hypothetical protein